MPLDSATIDRIVAGVLTQLGGDDAARRGGADRAMETRRHGESESGESKVQSSATAVATLSERVITADVLDGVTSTASLIEVSSKAIVTPAAWDLAKERGLTIRRTAIAQPASTTQSALNSPRSTLAPLLIVVHHTDAVSRVWDDLKVNWRREFLGCPDDAAKLAIAELSRGGTSQVVILADQTHRAACLANRHDQVKAVAVRDTADVVAVRTQLRANVWCVSPTGHSWFELRRLFKSLVPGP